MKHTILLQSMTPLAHGDTTNGLDNDSNFRIFMRQGMLVNGKPTRVPAISENALRTALLRRPIHDDLMSLLAINNGELPQSVVNLLFSGGSMASGSKAPSNKMSLGLTIMRTYPSLDLLGGALDGFMLPISKVKVTAWLLAKEYAPMLRQIAPEYVDEAEQVSAFDLVEGEHRTRGTNETSEGNQMIYGYETLAAGAKVLVELCFEHNTSQATSSVAGRALEKWNKYFGGQCRQGRGRMAVIKNDLPDATAYLEHVEQHKSIMRDGLITGMLGTERVLCA